MQDVDPLLDYLENNLKVLYKKLEATIYPLFSEEILKAEIIVLLENLEVGVTRYFIPIALLCRRPYRAEALSDDARLTSVWRLSVCPSDICLSVRRVIGPKSRTELPRKTA